MTASQSASAIQTFLNGVGRIPLLSPDATLIHARNVRKHLDWDVAVDGAIPSLVEKRGNRSLNILIESNLRLVVNIAKKYVKKNNHELLDLVQEGALGLRRGVQLYDPVRGYKISTYLYWWIRQGITRSIILNNSLIKLPFGVSDQIRKIRIFTDIYQAKYAKSPLPSEIAEALKISKEKVNDILVLATKDMLISLDAPFRDHDSPISDLVAGAERNEVDDELTASHIIGIIESNPMIFSHKEKHLIQFCILNGGSMSDYAKLKQCSRERVRQQRNTCRRKLQRFLTTENYFDHFDRIEAVN